ncbi:unnamed protein product [Pleuronectes platessa]|uniref:Uncharacterized protein n=1 Tax=Pleuronectes platessa TaxID=8262 RepID=A0A9N7UDF5_PLEPL|nr:unnamed protein product [Pleuronectes platessa]
MLTPHWKTPAKLGFKPGIFLQGGFPVLNILAARRQPRRTAGGGPPRERRVPPAGAVAEVIREKGPTRAQSRCRRPPYPVPSNGPPSAPATDTAPRSKRKKAPRTTDAVRHSGIGPPPPKNLEACRTPSLRRRGEEGDCSPSRGTCPAV